MVRSGASFAECTRENSWVLFVVCSRCCFCLISRRPLKEQRLPRKLARLRHPPRGALAPWPWQHIRGEEQNKG